MARGYPLSWELVVLLFVYPLFACGLAIGGAAIVYRTKLSQEAWSERAHKESLDRAHAALRQKAIHEHEIRVLEMKREDQEFEAKRSAEADQRAREERTTRIEDTMRNMGWKPPESTVDTSHPFGPPPISPQEAELERVTRTVHRVHELEETA